MLKQFTVTAPVIIAIVGAATIGASGATVAKHLITGKDIKDHSIGYVDLSKAAVKKIHGPTPKPFVQTSWYGGHIEPVDHLTGTSDFAAPVGYSVPESSSTSFIEAIGPDHAVTMTRLSVGMQDPPGLGSTISFSIDTGNGTSPVCSISDGAQTCTKAMSFAIPANSVLYLETTVSGIDASGGLDAAFSWMTKG